MKFSSSRLVIKMSVSDMLRSSRFYCDVLGFTVNDNYTINSGGKYGTNSYMELDTSATEGHFSIGLYKDIESSLSPAPNVGSVPSFIVDDLHTTLNYLQSRKVIIDNVDGTVIIKNVSDKGCIDEFFFFRDPDNNLLVMRQNIR